ncbi:MAG: 6-carboxytetrahydropterin synthase [Deltaproteobacteria bacterium]|nr:6-carboxytetrahydropterin synthase [Deltaproteobacteria bacterium]
MDLCVEFNFSAGHSLPDYNGPCCRFHGHNYKLVVTVGGKPDPKSGMIIDFEELRRIVTEEALKPVDHQNLNDFLPNPTAENIITFLWAKLRMSLPGLKELKLYETPEYWIVYRGD